MKRKYSIYATVDFYCPDCKEKIFIDFTDGHECACGKIWIFPPPVCKINNNRINLLNIKPIREINGEK